MAKLKEQQEAVKLRIKGLSYRQIRLKIPVSKGTLSIWLKEYPLSEKQLGKLRNQRHSGIEKFRETMRRKRINRLTQTYEEQRKKWLPLSDRELFMAGLFLYWGEGKKSDRHRVSINNTDPAVVKFALYWMLYSLKIPMSKIKVQLQLYSDMNVDSAIQFWSQALGIPKSHFGKPYVKQTKRTSLNQKGFGHGTCAVCCYKTEIKEKILMAIQVMTDHFDEKVGKPLNMKSLYIN